MQQFSGGVSAQPVVTIVNGVTLPEALVERVVKSNAQQDIKDTAELRQVIRNELIAREILSQEAVKRGLDMTELAKNQWALLRQSYLADLLMTDFAENNQIRDDDVGKEYERQVSLLKGAQQYKISSMVLANEAAAKAALSRLDKEGECFELVAREVSLDASRQQGGDLNWVLAEQIVPLISNVIVNFPKGATVAAPIQTPSGWHMIRLDEKRAFVIPSFSETKEQVLQGILQQRRNQFINLLRSQAKIEIAVPSSL